MLQIHAANASSGGGADDACRFAAEAAAVGLLFLYRLCAVKNELFCIAAYWRLYNDAAKF